MSSAHVAVCGQCNRSMYCDEVGVTLEMQAQGRPYYLIQADRYRCPGCGASVYSEFASSKIFHYHEKFQAAVRNHPNRVRIN